MRKGNIDEVEVPVEVVLGGASLSLKRLGRLTQGSIVQLESLAGEPVELRAAGEPIARGEVVIIDENFGIRVTELLAKGALP